ncbi:MAG: AAA domain-containing protein [Thermoleophilia bacterium]
MSGEAILAPKGIAVNNKPQESKELRLARYLKEFVGLRSTTVRDVDKYDTVLWFGDMPQESDCQSPAWSDDFEPGDSWLKVRKQRFPKPPSPPDVILPWIDQQAFKRATPEIPSLRQTVMLPDLDAKLDAGEDPPIVEQYLDDHPEIESSYNRFRPSWEAWSVEYQRRERIQAIYAELFRLHTQVRKQGEILELVLGLGLLSWPKSDQGNPIPVRRHIFTAQVELKFEPATGLIVLENAPDGAQLKIEDDMLEAELRPERSHYDNVEEQLSTISDDIWDRASMFTALKSWAGALHPDSQWSPELMSVADFDSKPTVSFAPALILRKRTQVGMVRIYDALIDRLSNDTEEIPAGWGGLIDDENDQDESDSWLHDGRENGQPDLDPNEIYFPLPANREQERIVDAINHRRGVLVQGPPGTGKSHTIANLMCHLLATGKRVLITAETARALQVLKNKLPEEIRPLCVSMLGQGGNSFAELNSAVQGITTRFATWSPGAYDKRIAELDLEISDVRKSRAEIDTELRALRAEETSKHSLMNGSYQGTASAIAARVTTERDSFCWLKVSEDAPDDPPISTIVLTDWLKILRRYDDDAISASNLKIVESEKLPTPATFARTVTSEHEASAAVEKFVEQKSHSAYIPIVALGSEARQTLADSLIELEKSRIKFSHFEKLDWINDALTEALIGRQAVWNALSERSHELTDKIEQLIKKLDSVSVSIPEGKDAKTVHLDANAVIDHLQSGGTWTRLLLLTPKALKDKTYIKDEIIVDGRPADTMERLTIVCNYLDLAFAFEDLDRTWSDHGGLPIASEPQIRLAAIKEHMGMLDKILSYARECREINTVLGAATPPIPEPNWKSGQAQEWLKIIEAADLEEQRRLAGEQVVNCLHDLKPYRDLHDAHPIITLLINAVEQRAINSYSQSYEQIQLVEQTKRDQELRKQTEASILAASSGLIEAVMDSFYDDIWDDRFSAWEQAWRWAIADNWLQKRTNVTYQQRLERQRHRKDEQVDELLTESASLRAWTHFFNRLSSKEAAALKSWREAVRAMGKGKGRSARLGRLRREARLQMEQCRDAIPAWIMPRYLVAEMIDPAPGRYDLVIVDEASQLGIESLFLFYIAKKMVVVGDDQQISPYGVGVRDDAIADLQQHYLPGIPHHHALSAQSSLYANAKIRFGQNIVLREHFRCMPEIIQFSNDLCYASNGTPLDPLRAYPVNRLRPLVVRHVPDGFRTGTSQNALNEPEADALVAQILACLADPRYSNRSMGVISLQGEAQAKLIERKLLQRLEPEVIEERRLICGDAYTFQGDERSVIFLSMVAAPGETRIGALANDSARQRFNVAASRAQDQLWLFHSATLDMLSNSCMRHNLLSYMLNPAREVATEEDQRFDSEFERDVFGIIKDRGYHVRTQVCIGDPTSHRYRIDLVVEGMQGRLAVECDGEQWHGPERYDQDMARQRDLERAGWQFVRIRGGDFYRDRSVSMEPLWKELERLGIKPGGIDGVTAEPPPPIKDQQFVRLEVDEEVPPIEENIDTAEASSAGLFSGENAADEDLKESVPDERQESFRYSTPPRESDAADQSFIKTSGEFGDAENNNQVTFEQRQNIQTNRKTDDPNSIFAPYVPYSGLPFADPRNTHIGNVTDGLRRIIDVEGPMFAKRAYDIYLRGCNIRRMGRDLKSTLNTALQQAITEKRVISEDELGKGGLLYSIVRPAGCPPVIIRKRGPRNFEEIPPSELLVVARYYSEKLNLEVGSDKHMRTILHYFDLVRLTTQVGTTFLDILEKRFAYVDELLETLREESD